MEFNKRQKINKYPKEKWADLLALIPVIEQLNNSGLPVTQKFPYDLYSQVESDFFDIVHKMSIVIVFDWINWIKDKPYFKDDFEGFNDLSLVELCQIITVIVRNDRFSDYFIRRCMHDQTILKILKAIELKVNQEKRKNPIWRILKFNSHKSMCD